MRYIPRVRKGVARKRSAVAIRLIAIGTIAAAAALPGARAQPVATDEPAIVVRLEPPPQLMVGARAEVIARVQLGDRAGRPMLLTPSAEGTAVEVVRGRLTRADADVAEGAPGEDARELLFRIPIVARMVGTAVVRVRVDGFSCRDGLCHALPIEESIAIEVSPAAARAEGSGPR